MLIPVLRPDKPDFKGPAATMDIARGVEVPDLLILVDTIPASTDRSAVATDVPAEYGATTARGLRRGADMVTQESRGLFGITGPAHERSQTQELVSALSMERI